MTKSMTAFARVEKETFVWEIRSVNHRYLDASFRMPENLRHLETALKAKFRNRVHRGKLDCTLKITGTSRKEAIEINEDLVRQLTGALDKVAELSGLNAPTDALQLMKWPDVIVNEGSDDELGKMVTAGFSEAVEALVEMRSREGEELANVIADKLAEIETIVVAVRDEAPKIEASQAEKLRSRIDSLNLEVDPARLETELVILAQKQDVMEELDRLDTHIAEVRRNLGLAEPVGRRLDFLMQELNREANTLSSKAVVAGTTMHAVDLKVIIEQMREQIQNIE